MKHFFFDMDGTLTRTRTEVTDKMHDLLKAFTKKGADVVVVSGGTWNRIHVQLGNLIEEMYILAQNGNVAQEASGGMLWEHKLNWVQQFEIFKTIQSMRLRKVGEVVNEIDLVENRGSQISFSFVGHHAPIQEKENFDPHRKKRRQVLAEYADDIKGLESHGIFCAIGGTTCIDFYAMNKGQNIKEFIKEKGWNKTDCIYVGDALDEGGNDASVIGIIPTRAVRDHIECEDVIKEFIDNYVPEIIETEENELMGEGVY